MLYVTEETGTQTVSELPGVKGTPFRLNTNVGLGFTVSVLEVAPDVDTHAGAVLYLTESIFTVCTISPGPALIVVTAPTLIVPEVALVVSTLVPPIPLILK
jgi:hypothetical protein